MHHEKGDPSSRQIRTEKAQRTTAEHAMPAHFVITIQRVIHVGLL